MRKPDFLCIGSQKAGTTWLDRNLRQHPQVWMPAVKELHYFDYLFLMEGKFYHLHHKKVLKGLIEKINKKIDDPNSRITFKYLEGIAKVVFVEKPDDDWYFSLFDDAPTNCITGDITPAYSALPEEGVQYISKLLTEVKIIHIIRNPIKRAWSCILMGKREEISNNKKIEINEWKKGIRAPINQRLSDQKATVELYSKYFSLDQIIYVFYDDICHKPLEVLQNICNFLQIDYRDSFFEKIAAKRVNANPKHEMPEEVKNTLVAKYKEQEEWLKQRFNLDNLDL
jgi:hypothetical protein